MWTIVETFLWEWSTVLPGKPYWRGRISTIDLLVLTSLDQLLLILKILFIFFTKQASSMRRSTVLGPPLLWGFPVFTNVGQFWVPDHWAISYNNIFGWMEEIVGHSDKDFYAHNSRKWMFSFLILKKLNVAKPNGFDIR